MCYWFLVANSIQISGQLIEVNYFIELQDAHASWYRLFCTCRQGMSSCGRQHVQACRIQWSLTMAICDCTEQSSNSCSGYMLKAPHGVITQ